MKIVKILAMAGVLVGASMNVSAGVITTYVGDVDGFGGQTAPNAVGVITNAGFDNRTAADPAFTDVWQFWQSGGAAASPSFSFTYDLGGATAESALLSIMESGMSDGRGPWNVLFNGNLAGSIADGFLYTSVLRQFAINTSWLSGSTDSVSLVYADTDGEGYAIDFSSLSISTRETPPETVPEPGTLAILGLGLMGIVITRRKYQAS